jgi:hypothetical protein
VQTACSTSTNPSLPAPVRRLDGVVKILLATDNYPPYIGGAQIQSHLLASEMRDRGHQVVVATVWQSSLPRSEDLDGVREHRLRHLRTLPALARKRWQH